MSIQGIYNFFWSINLPILILGLGILYFIIQSFYIVYHLIRFGIGPKPKFVALLYVLGSSILFILTIIAWTKLDLSGLYESLINF